MNITIPFTNRKINISIPKSINPLDDGYYDGSFSDIFSTDGKKNTSEQLKAYEGWVGDCVSLIDERVASIPLRLYYNGELVEKHKFYDLIQKWNPYTTKFEGKELLQIYLDLTGECYIHVVKDRLGHPQELYFRQPDKISPIVKNGAISHYIEKEGLTEKRYEANDILFFKYPSPTNPFRGASPVQRKAYAYDTDKYNMIYQLNVFKNGVHLKQVLESEKNMPPDQVKKILTLFDQTYGGAEKAHKTGALVGGMTLKTVGVSNKDMEFMALAEWTMRQLASAYHVPPQKLSHPESTNLANMTALDTAWNRECILPRLVRQEEVFNTFLLPLYDIGLYCKYDNPVPIDEEFILKKRESDLKCFVITPNEARVEDGLDEVPWGKVPLVPMNIMPLSSGSELRPEPEPPKALLDWAIKEYKYTEDYKRKYWELFIKRITPMEEDFKRAMIKLFQEQELRALRALRGKKSIETKDIDDVLRVTHDEREIMKFAEVVLPRITQMVKKNGEAAAAELGLGFDVTNPEVMKWIKKHTGESIKSILDTTFEALKRTLAEGVEAGESIPKLAARITKEYEDCKGYKAVRIARTETITASNSGAYQSYKQSGVVKKKEWLATMDDRVRPEHASMNGQVVDLDKPFSNGEMFPSSINCRCTVLPVLKE